MAGLPGVNIIVENGALGRVATTKDGIAGLILVGVALAGIPLYVPKQIFSLKDAENLGITKEQDTEEDLDTWLQIKEFYDEAGTGAELWVMLVPVTKTMAELADPATTVNNARRLLDDAKGTIRLLGFSRYIDDSVEYEQVTVGGLDKDVTDALPKAQALAIEYRDNIKPVQIILDGRGWSGTPSDLTDLRTGSHNKVSIALATSQPGKDSASIGLVLGRLAKIPVQRNIGRVKDGALNVSQLYYTDGSKIETFSHAQIAAIHDKGYITPRFFTGKVGYFFADDPTATSANDDYLTIANNRVIDKALTIVYDVYVNEINDEIEISTEGKLAATKLTYYKQIITNALTLNMLANGEVSAIEVNIDADQNILANDQLNIEVRVTPVGYAKSIVVSLGFKNPLNN
jgi:hypothetical protein